MCELLALSSSTPARLTFSLQTLAARGGSSGSSHDGWGVALYEGTDVALLREQAAAADNALVRFLETEGPVTNLSVSQLRIGSVSVHEAGARAATSPDLRLRTAVTRDRRLMAEWSRPASADERPVST